MAKKSATTSCDVICLLMLVALLTVSFCGAARASPPADAWGPLPALPAPQVRPSSWTPTCSGCHGAGGNVNIQSWPTNHLAGLDASNFVTRLNAQAANSSSMPDLAVDNTEGRLAARAALLQYLIDARDGKVIATRGATSSPTDLVMGSAVVNSGSTSGSVTLTNERSNSIGFVKSATSNGFSVVLAAGQPAACASNSVPAGGSCELDVTFTPTGTSGPRTSTLNITLTPTGGDPALPARAIALSGTATAPLIALASTSAAFSAYTNFDSDTKCVKVSNNGDAALTLTGVTFTQPSPAPVPAGNEYTAGASSTPCATETTLPVCVTGTTLSPSPAVNSCQVVVQFAPRSAGTRTGGVSISHDDGTQATRTIVLNGSALPTPVPALQLTAPTITPFGERALNGTAISQGVGIANSDALATLTWATTRFEIRDDATSAISTEFLPSNGTCTAATLGPQASCIMQVQYRPLGATEGTRNATLRIFSSNASNSPITVALTGSAKLSAAPVVSTPAAFADTVVDIESPDTRTVTIENLRSTVLNYVATRTGPDAADVLLKTDACAGTIPAAQTCQIVLAFKPRSGPGVGTRSASLSLAFTATGGDPAPTPNPVTRPLTGLAIGPLSITPTTLSPAAQVTLSGSSSTLLTNHGATALTLSALAFEGSFPAEYSLPASSACQVGTTLPPNGFCELNVAFAPTQTGARPAALRVTHTALGSPQSITLSGVGAAAPQARIVLGSFDVAFAVTQIGGSSTQGVTVRNLGDLPLHFSSLALGGTNAADFERAGDCAVATPLAVGATCTLGLTFRPTALGARAATLTIQSDATDPTVVVALSGTAVPVPAPVVSLVPATLAFGEQTVGGLYPTRTVRLANTGNAALSIAAITVDGAVFTVAPACPATLAPNAGCDINVAFAPTAAGTDYSGNLRIASNAAGSPHSAPLTGRGVAAAAPALTWDEATRDLAFGDVAVGTVSAPQTMTLRNSGPGGATLSVLNAVGTGASAFSVGGGDCQVGTVLFAGQTCSVQVRFAPGGPGARSAVLQAASSGSLPPEVRLAGTGLGGPAADIALSAGTLSLGATRVGATSLPAELVVSSSGSGTLQVTAISVTGPYSVLTRSCPALPFTLAPGAQCSVGVMFQPQAVGTAAGVLSVATNADAGNRQVTLDGTGEAAPDVSSGGCSLVSGNSPTDPTLWVLSCLAVAALLYRRRLRHHAARANPVRADRT
ncbi:hypothetical protein BH11PSE8_BH11PSE8_00250 [soil metagenome]